MRYAKIEIQGIAPYSQSRFHGTDKLNKEGAQDYEERTWKEKAHYGDDGHMFIPALAPKNAIAEAAKYLSIQIPGKGKSTYTKHFEAGVMVFGDSTIFDKDGNPVTRETIVGDRLHVPSDGRRGGGSRVMRVFPSVAPGWTATIEFSIMDDTITEEVFKQHILQAGQLIGIGSFRPRNNGIRGRFVVKSVEWIDNYSLEVAA